MEILKRWEVEELFHRFKKQNVRPTTELIYHSHFELLIAVMLSAHANDRSVNKATKGLFAVANTPQKVLILGSELDHFISNINLYRIKAERIRKTCEMILNLHQGKLPSERHFLEELPGVGRKTANIILNEVFGIPTIAVDTHVFRTSRRLGLATKKTPLCVEKELMDIVPKVYQPKAHHWLVLHGRYVCTARNPLCHSCLVSDLCPSFNKQTSAS